MQSIQSVNYTLKGDSAKMVVPYLKQKWSQNNPAQFSNTPLHRLCKLLLLCSQYCGVAPLLNGQRNACCGVRQLHRVWCLALLLHISVVNCMQGYNSVFNHRNVTTIERGLYLSEFVTNTLIVAFTIGNCHYYATYYTNLPQQMLNIYKKLQHLRQEHNYQDTIYFSLYRELLGVTLSASTFLISCFVIDLIYCKFDVLETFRSSSAYNIPNVLISFNLGQYWLALRLIYHLYSRINAIIQHLLDDDHFSLSSNVSTVNNSLPELPHSLSADLDWYRREFSNHSHISRVSSISNSTGGSHDLLSYVRALYADLDRMLAQLTHAYQLIVLLNFLGSFLDLTVQNFAVYKFFDRPNIDDLVLFIYKVLWLILHAGRYFFVLLPHNAIIKEKNRTAFILNELKIISNGMEHEVNRFILQLMVRKPESSCGIISLDLMFLSSILNVLATYVIFLIQIDLGSESLVGSNLNRTG